MREWTEEETDDLIEEQEKLIKEILAVKGIDRNKIYRVLNLEEELAFREFNAE